MDEVLRRALDQNDALRERVLGAAHAVGGADYLLSTECTGSDRYRLIRLGEVMTELRAALGLPGAHPELIRAYPPEPLPPPRSTSGTDDRTHGRDEG